jgi:hypothetical protein
VLIVCALAAVAASAAGQSPAKTYKGLEVSVAGVTRATNVSLSDCPPGANTQRGVIKPGDTTEFASVTLDFKALPAIKPGVLAKPVLHDESGKTYNTAQSFGEITGGSSFSCTFSFRVPKGAKVTKLSIDSTAFVLAAQPQ